MKTDAFQEVMSHAQMTIKEGLSLQRGMNFRPSGKDYSIFLMSVNENAQYSDGFDEAGKILTYEGHNINRGEQKTPCSLISQCLQSQENLQRTVSFLKQPRTTGANDG